jgi:hypothetical protein
MQSGMSVQPATLPRASARPRICFLFNHDAAHQASHIAAIAGQLAIHHPELDVIAATGTPGIATHLRQLLTPDQIYALQWHDLSLPRWANRVAAPLNRILPAQRVARLQHGLDFFASLDALVSTERTCLRVKRNLAKTGLKVPQFIYVPHGSGDRNVAYHPELAQFDLMLLSGQKLVDEMVRHKIFGADQTRLIGYAKFDTVDMSVRPRFFGNDNPVFVYNPHFDPHLSSWYDHGPAMLDWFASPQGQNYNLIFAPHVMLFRKKLHISLEYRTARRRPDVVERWKSAPNIHIDVDSPQLFDMSYMRAADAYIGDVSSQVYEFLVQPRPVFFIDSHAKNTAEYDFWGNGPVVGTVADLISILPDYVAIGGQYAAAQQEKMNYTIDRSDPRPASIRGAEALADYLKAI